MLSGILAFSFICLAPIAQADDTQDPSSRVIRLNYVSGQVSFSPSGTNDWTEAQINRPLVSGDRLWVERGDRAEMHLGSTAIRMAGGTALEVLRINDDELQLKVTQGSMSMRVRDYSDAEDIEVDTPNLAFEVRDPGEFRLDVDADRDTTQIQVRKGAGSAFTDDDSLKPVRIYDGQRFLFSGDRLRVEDSSRADPRDVFDRWAAARDDREQASRSVRYVSNGMTGYEDLDDNGDWQQVDGYGSVWYPRVTITNWAPYQYGHWAWVPPWGWTWIDDAPWGFAPFHYGRWAYIGNHWGWVPGPVVRRPVYAPALVAFVGGGNGGSRWGVSVSGGAPGVAWFPLGPGEAYRPTYSQNQRYVERINVNISLNRPGNVYVNQRVPHAIAVMPEHDFQRGVPIRPGSHADFHDADFGRMPVHAGLPLAPVRESRSGSGPVLHQEPPRVFANPVMRQPAFGPQGGRTPVFGNDRIAPRQPQESPRRQDDMRHLQDAQRQQDDQRRQQDQQRQQQEQQDQQRRQQDQQRQQDDQRRQQDQQRQQQEQQRQQQDQQRRQQDQQRQQDDQRRQQDQQRQQQEQQRQQQDQQRRQQDQQRQQDDQRRQQDQQRQQQEQQRQQQDQQRRQQDQQRQQDDQRRQQDQQRQQQQQQQQRHPQEQSKQQGNPHGPHEDER
jgi:hypothetical protein